ncbi:MAG: hypothetical protein SVT52_03405 [Planctomycetota bacterium]|nr:hypothetical protein [Planctomycetota bacterium]
MKTNKLSLAKGGCRYLFRYSSGCEDQIINEIIRLADDSETNLTWLDAATLSLQVAQRAATECQNVISPVARQSH